MRVFISRKLLQSIELTNSPTKVQRILYLALHEIFPSPSQSTSLSTYSAGNVVVQNIPGLCSRKWNCTENVDKQKEKKKPITCKKTTPCCSDDKCVDEEDTSCTKEEEADKGSPKN